MRKIVAGMFVSVDGVVESPDKWQRVWDDQMAAALGKTLDSCDTVLMGRVSYSGFAEYWPNYSGGEDAAFADWINNAPKYVVSNTLTDVSGWQHSHLITGTAAAAEIRRLKEGTGKDIAVAGSPSLVGYLLEHDLLDQLDLMIIPVVAGGGLNKLFRADATMKNLTLASAEPTPSGTILATYLPAS